MRPDVYNAPYLKAKFKYANNGFFARKLDADDQAFLRYVAKHGSANGNVPGPNTLPLIEELDYWHFPYAVDQTVVRRVGPAIPPEIIPDADGVAKRQRRLGDRVLLAAEKKAIQTAWEHEQQRLAKERDERIMQQLRADIEWNKNHPAEKRGRHTPQTPRHHVPDWKLHGWPEDPAVALAREERRKKQEEDALRVAREAQVRLQQQQEREQRAVQMALIQAEQAERAAIAETEEKVMRSLRESRSWDREVDDILDFAPPDPESEDESV